MNSEVYMSNVLEDASNHWRNEFPFAASGIESRSLGPTSLRVDRDQEPVDPQRRGAQGPTFYARRGKREFITPVVAGIS
jgi:hypothetical protein